MPSFQHLCVFSLQVIVQTKCHIFPNLITNVGFLPGRNTRMTTVRKLAAFVVSTKREVTNYGRGGEEKVVCV